MNSSNSKIRQTVNKLRAILISYRLVNHAPVLVKSKNIAKKGVIWRGDDVKESKAFLKQFRAPKFDGERPLAPLSSHSIHQLENVKIKGAATGGICFGASLSLIKALTLADIKSEKELLAIACQYKNGFSAEAAGLQSLLVLKIASPSRYTDEEYQIEVAKINALYDKERGQLKNLLDEKIKTLSPDDFETFCREDMSKLSNDLKDRVSYELTHLIQYQKISNHVHHIAALIDLEISGRLEQHEKAFFYGITRSEVVKKKI